MDKKVLELLSGYASRANTGLFMVDQGIYTERTRDALGEGGKLFEASKEVEDILKNVPGLLRKLEEGTEIQTSLYEIIKATEEKEPTIPKSQSHKLQQYFSQVQDMLENYCSNVLTEQDTDDLETMNTPIMPNPSAK